MSMHQSLLPSYGNHTITSFHSLKWKLWKNLDKFWQSVRSSWNVLYIELWLDQLHLHCLSRSFCQNERTNFIFFKMEPLVKVLMVTALQIDLKIQTINISAPFPIADLPFVICMNAPYNITLPSEKCSESIDPYIDQRNPPFIFRNDSRTL